MGRIRFTGQKPPTLRPQIMWYTALYLGHCLSSDDYVYPQSGFILTVVNRLEQMFEKRKDVRRQ